MLAQMRAQMLLVRHFPLVLMLQVLTKQLDQLVIQPLMKYRSGLPLLGLQLVEMLALLLLSPL
uniref:Uncharacterized protein n=2 Tax=Picea TaxID=3328 RepID=A0A101LXM1_PICGL|nr:hypothetical protein ABT39_MTgene5419 [Picea glauca]QHR91477.1 hypothetical protein Q903MT_gene5512 [Picea sitchensis]